MNYTITITRQFGSLGRPIAREIADALKIHYYDRDIVEQVSQKLHYPVRLSSDEEERAKTKFWRMKYPLGRGTTARQDEIFAVERDIITDIARTESSVIVGRCSDYILENQPGCLHVYIYAPYRDRIRNCIETLHMQEEEAIDMIRSVDEARESFHLRYARYKPEDILHKDLLINSSVLGVDGTAKHIVEIAEDAFGLR